MKIHRFYDRSLTIIFSATANPQKLLGTFKLVRWIPNLGLTAYLPVRPATSR